MAGRLDGKVAIITGAGDGMGRAAALRFSEEGAKIVIAEINEANGLAVEKELKDLGREALFVKTDIGNEENVKAAVEKAVEKFGKIDILYNNAAVGGGIYKNTDKDNAPLWETDTDDWQKLVQIDLNGPYFMLKYVIPVMLENKYGSIINAGSANALQAVNNIDAYTAAKGAVVSLTRTLASRLGKHGIRVNCLCPGGVHTRMLTNNEGNEVSDLTVNFFKRIPLKRVGEPQEIANAALFLASDEASYITGIVLPVDGGWTAI